MNEILGIMAAVILVPSMAFGIYRIYRFLTWVLAILILIGFIIISLVAWQELNIPLILSIFICGLLAGISCIPLFLVRELAIMDKEINKILKSLKIDNTIIDKKN